LQRALWVYVSIFNPETDGGGVGAVAILRSLGEAVCRLDNLEDVYGDACAHWRGALSCDAVALMIGPRRGRFEIAGIAGPAAPATRQVLEQHSPWARDDDRLVPLVLPDLDCGARATGPSSLVGEGVGAAVFVPLFYHGRLLGHLAGLHHAPRDWSPDAIFLGQAIANLVAFAFARGKADDERTEALRREQIARTVAESANRSKDEFLATLSHELRTPLNAIMGWTRLLRTGKLDDAAASKALETIERNTHVQAQLVDDLLDISRIITGKLRLEVRPLELHTVLETAMEAVRPAAEAKSIPIHAVIDPSAGRVQGDADRLQQVFWNLLSNAIKFTPEGGTVTVRLERVDPHVQVTVQDTGVGISPAFLPYVFDRLCQSDGNYTKVNGGLGLGLAIAKHLVELHGGSVTAGSEGVDRGATFTLRLPIAAVKLQTGADFEAGLLAGSRKILEGVTVLVVDDEHDARELLATVLSSFGAGVSDVSSVTEALEAIERVKPDVLVCDIGMPVEDGYSLIRKVRALTPEAGGRIPAVALTAFARPEDRARSLLAGFQLHVPKPVKPSELAVVVATLAGRIERVQALPGWNAPEHPPQLGEWLDPV
jgi:signal transduction histidine kinase/ActR/RegA family two-component response regulator